MEKAIRTLVAVAEGLDRFEVERSLPDHPSVQLVGILQGIDETVRAMREAEFDVLLVASSGPGDRALHLVDAVVHAKPNIPIVVLSTNSPNGFLRRAFEAGAADVLMFPQPQEQLRFALAKALARRSGVEAARQQQHGEIVCVIGPKGGSGKTLTATNLAVVLAELRYAVTIVDIDLQFGDVALTMGLRPEATIYDLATSGGSLDQDVLDHYLIEHASGVRALIAPSRPDQASAVTPDLIRESYALLRQTSDFVIVDTPPGFTAEVITSIDASSGLVMVGMLDSLSLKNTKLGLETLGLMGFDPNGVKLVLNRAHSRVGISVSDVIAVLGREPDVYVPSDREIPRAVNDGVPIVTARPESEATAAFRSLAHLFAVQTAPVAARSDEKPRRRLFARRR